MLSNNIKHNNMKKLIQLLFAFLAVPIAGLAQLDTDKYEYMLIKPEHFNVDVIYTAGESLAETDVMDDKTCNGTGHQNIGEYPNKANDASYTDHSHGNTRGVFYDKNFPKARESQTFKPLPDDRILKGTGDGLCWYLQPYNQNNAIKLTGPNRPADKNGGPFYALKSGSTWTRGSFQPTDPESVTLTFENEGVYKAFYVAATATNVAGSTANMYVTVNFSDGTTETPDPFQVADWCAGAKNLTSGYATKTYRYHYFDDNQNESGYSDGFRVGAYIKSCKVVINTKKLIKSVTISTVNAANPCNPPSGGDAPLYVTIFAITGEKGELEGPEITEEQEAASKASITATDPDDLNSPWEFDAKWEQSSVVGYYLSVSKNRGMTDFVDGYNLKVVDHDSGLSGSTISSHVTGLDEGTIYYYAVKGYNKENNIITQVTNYSRVIEFATSINNVGGDDFLNIRTKDIGAYDFTAEWTPLTQYNAVTGYKLQLYAGEGCSLTNCPDDCLIRTIAVSGNSASECYIDGLEPDVEYFIKITPTSSYNNGMEGIASIAAAATTDITKASVDPVSVTYISSSSCQLDWSALNSAKVKGYKIYKSNSALTEANYASGTPATVTTNTYTATGLSTTAKTYFAVVPYTNDTNCKPAFAVFDPTVLVATISSTSTTTNSIALQLQAAGTYYTWNFKYGRYDRNTSSGTASVDEYKIFYSADKNFSNVQEKVFNVTATSSPYSANYTLNNLSEGTVYYIKAQPSQKYKTRAYSSSYIYYVEQDVTKDYNFSTTGNVLTVWTSISNIKPSNLKASNIECTSFDLSWDCTATAVTKYEVYVNGAKVGETNATSFTVTGLSYETTYNNIYVKPFDANNQTGQNSDGINVTTGTVHGTSVDDFAGTALSTTSTSLMWTPITTNTGYYSGYRIYRSVGGGAFNQIAQINSLSTATYTDSNLDVYKMYQYKIVPIDIKNHECSMSDAISVRTLPDFDENMQVTGVAADSPTQSKIHVSWNKINSTLISKYVINYSKNADMSDASQVEAGNVDNYDVQPLDFGTRYYFTVQAYAEELDKYTKPSAIVSACTDIDWNQEITAVCGAAANGGDNTISVAWQPSTLTGVKGYHIYYSKVQNSFNNTDRVFVDYKDSSGNLNSSYTFTNLDPSTTYYYKFRTVDYSGNEGKESSSDPACSSQSETVTNMSGNEVVRNLNVINIQTTSARITWLEPENASGVDHYIVVVKDAKGNTLINTTSTNLAYDVTGLTHATNYTVEVTPANAANSTGKAASKSFATKLDQSITVTNPQASPRSTSVIEVTWTVQCNNDAIEGYHIYYSKDAAMNGASTMTVKGVNATKGRITGLEVYTEYFIQVVPYMSSTEATKSAIVSAKTYLSSDVTVEIAVDPAKMEVTAKWYKANADAVQNYFVSLIKKTTTGETVLGSECINRSEAQTDDGGTFFSHTFTGLQEGTNYEVRVDTYGSDGCTTVDDIDNYGGSASKEFHTDIKDIAASDLSITAGSVKATEVGLEWTNTDCDAITGYYIEYSTTSTFDNGTTNRISISSAYNSTTLKSLEPGTDYWFRSQAYAPDKVSSKYSNVVSATTLIDETIKVTNDITATGAANKVIVNWTPAANNKVTGYYVYYCLDADCSCTNTVVDVPGRSAKTTTISGLPAGTTYYVKVVPYDGNGAKGGDSNIASATTNIDETVTLGSDVTATPQYVGGKHQIKLEWDKSVNAAVTGYYVYYAESSETLKTATPHDAGNNATYTIDNLKGATKYYIKVVPYDKSKNLGGAKYADATTLVDSSITVKNVTATGAEHSIEVSWTPLTGVAGYHIYYCAEAACSCSTFASVNGAETQNTIITATPDLPAATKYYVKVVPFDALGNEGGDSNIAEATTTIDSSVKVTITATGGEKKVTVAWDKAASGITNYRVFYSTQISADGKNLVDASYKDAGSFASSATNSVTYDVTGLNSATLYYFQVLPLVNSMEGSKSNIVSATTTITSDLKVSGVKVEAGAVAADNLTASLVISWNELTANTGITGYKVYYSTNSDMSDAQFVTTGTTGTQTISGLTPATKYYVQVAPLAGSNEGGKSDIVEGATAISNKVVAQFLVAVGGDKTVSLSWQAATNTNVSGYYVYYAENEADLASATPLDAANKTTYNITGLKPSTTYWAKVVPYVLSKGSYSFGGDSNHASATTKISSDVKALITSVTPTENSVTVVWTAPENSDAVDAYIVTINKKSDGTEVKKVSVDAPTTTTTITGLSAATNYTVTVAPATIEGETTTLGGSDSKEFATLIGTLSVDDADITTTPGYYDMSVTFPLLSNDAIKEYTVTISDGTNSQTKTVSASTDLPVKFDGLNANTEYTISVTPKHTNNTAGTTTSVTKSTLNPANVSVSNLAVQSTTETSATVQWSGVANIDESGIYGYQILVDGQVVSATISGKTATITGLESSKEYTIGVTPILKKGTAAGDSGTMKTCDATTKMSSSSKVVITKVTPAETSASFEWTCPANNDAITGYEVRVLNGATEVHKSVASGKNTNSYTVPAGTLTAGTDYKVVIRPTDGTNFGTSAEATFATTCANIQVSSISATPAYTSMTVSFTKVSATAIDSYKIEILKGTSNVGTATVTNADLENSSKYPVKFTGLDANTQYTIKVTPYDGTTAAKTATTTKSTLDPTDITVDIISGETLGVTSVKASWKSTLKYPATYPSVESGDLEGYVITCNGATVAAGNMQISGNSVTINNLSGSTEYTIGITPIIAGIECTESTVSVMTAMGNDLQVTITGFTPNNSDVTKGTLNWTLPANTASVDGLKATITPAKGGSAVFTKNDIAKTATSLDVTGLTAGTDYIARVWFYSGSTDATPATYNFSTAITSLTASDVQMTAGYDKIKVDFKTASGDAIDQYEVVLTGGGKTFTKTVKVADLSDKTKGSVLFEGLSTNTEYGVVITPKDTDNSTSGTATTEVKKSTKNPADVTVEGLTAIDVKTNSIKVQWTGLSDASLTLAEVSKYNVYLDGVKVSEVSKELKVSELTGLTNATQYKIEIQPVLTYGDGGKSEVTVTTLIGDVAVTITTITPATTSAKIEWTTPTNKDGITGYEVKIYQGTTVKYTTTVSGNTTAVCNIPTGTLTEGTDYKAEVRAVAGATQSSKSDEKTFSTLCTNVTATGVKATASYTSMVVEFTPATATAVDKYKVVVKQGATEKFSTELTLDDLNDATKYPVKVTGLNPNTAYTVTVTPYDTDADAANQKGKETTINVNTKNPSAITVTDLTGHTIDQESISATWSGLSDKTAEGDISGYTIELKKGGTVISSPAYTIDGNKVTFTGLTSATQYTIGVTPLIKGVSGTKATTTASTSMGGDVKVSDLTFTANESDATKGTLTWTLPENRATIDGYMIVVAPANGGANVVDNKTVGKEIDTYNVTGLALGTKYTATVMAYKDANKADAVTTSFTTSIAELKASDLTLTAGYDKMHVEFSPASGDAIDQYDIIIKDGTTVVSTQHVIVASSTLDDNGKYSVDFSSLTPDTEYTIVVTPKDNDPLENGSYETGEELSDTQSTKNPADVVVSGLTVVNTTTSSVKVQWTGLTDSGLIASEVSGYNVYIDDVKVEGASVIVDKSAKTAEIKGLDNAKEYKVEIQPVLVYGDGGKEDVMATTLIGDAVVEITNITPAKTSAKVEWSTPTNKDGITGYNVKVYNGTTKAYETTVTGNATAVCNIPAGTLAEATNYRVVVRAMAGTTESSAYDEENFATLCSDVQVGSVTPTATYTTIKVEFTPVAATATAIDKYKVVITGSDFSKEVTLTNDDLNDEDKYPVVATGLKPDTEYTITVTPYDGSEAGKALSVTKSTKDPNGVTVTELTGQTVDAATISATWSGFSDAEAASEVTGYVITLNGNSAPHTISGNKVTFTGLTNSTEYTIGVTPIIGGVSSGSEVTTTAHTAMGEGVTITNLKFTADTNDATKGSLTWNKPTNDAAIQGYKVTIVPTGGGDKIADGALVDKLDLQYAVTGLAAGTTYTASVQGYSSTGVTAAISTTFTTSIKDLQASGVTLTPDYESVKVEFTPAAGDVIDEYEVVIKKKEDGSIVDTKNIKTTEIGVDNSKYPVVFSPLDANTEYTVEITPKDTDKPSSDPEYSGNKISEDIKTSNPGTVTVNNLAVVETNESTIVVDWRGLTDSTIADEKVDHYVVYLNGTETTAVVDKDNKTATISGLTNATDYTVAIQPIFTFGDGKTSDTVSARTSVGNAQVSGITVTPDKTDAVIEWTVPTNNAGITGYDITITDADNKVVYGPITESGATANEHIVPAGTLTPGTDYTVSIKPTNGTNATTKDFATSIDGLTTTVTTTSGFTKVEVDFSPVSGNAVDSYEITVKDKNDSQVGSTITLTKEQLSSSLPLTIDNLNSGEDYTIEVRPYDGTTAGSLSSASVTTKDLSDLKVGNLNVTPAEQSATLSWDDILFDGTSFAISDLTNIEVKVYNSSNVEVGTVTLNGDKLGASINNLTAGSKYTAKVTPIVEGDKRGYTESISFSTSSSDSKATDIDITSTFDEITVDFTPASEETIVKHIVELQDSEGNTIESVEVTDPSQIPVKFTGLDDGTTYIVVITPVDEDGKPAVATDETITTKDLDDITLENFRVTDTTTTTAVLKWDDIKYEETSFNMGDVTGFNIIVKDSEGGVVSCTTSVNADKKGATISGLEEGKNYTVIVAPVIAAGTGSSSSEDFHTSIENAKVDNLVVEPDYDEIIIDFDPEDEDKDAVKEYEVVISDEDGNPVKTETITDPDQLPLIITPLEPGKQYTVDVTPVDEDGNKGKTTSETVNTKSLTDLKVQNLKGETIDTQTIKVTWIGFSDTEITNDKVIGYDIVVKKTDGTVASDAVVSINKEGEFATISGLDIATTYNVSVAPIIAAGTGASETVSATTAIGEISVSDIKVTSTETTAHIEWTNPSTTDGIAGYEVVVKDAEGNEFVKTTDSSTDTSIDFIDLTPGTKYTVTIRPKDESSKYGSAAIEEFSTRIDNLSVSDVVIDSDFEEVIVDFKPADGDAIKEYEIVITDKDGNVVKTETVDSRDIDTLPIHIPGLTPGEDYVISITPVDINGEKGTTVDTPVSTKSLDGIKLTGLRGETVDETTVRIIWSGLEDQFVSINDVTGYDIVVKLDGKVIDDAVVTIDMESHIATITGLKHATTYDIEVTPSISAGKGSATATSATTAFTDLKVENIKVTPADESALVEWTLPEATDGLYGYLVVVTDVNNNVIFTTTTDGADKTSATVESLKPATKYTVKVQPSNGVGGLGAPEYKEFSTSASTVGVGNVEVDPTYDEIKIDFKPADGNSIEEYEVVVKDKDGNVIATETITNDELSKLPIIIDGLNDGTDYVVEITPIDNNGDKGKTETVEVSTKNLDDLKVTDLKIDEVTDNSITVTWSGISDGTIDQSTVTYQVTATDSEGNAVPSDKIIISDGKAAVTGLEEGKVYTITVTPVIPEGVGGDKSVETATKIGDVEVGDLTATYVQVLSDIAYQLPEGCKWAYPETSVGNAGEHYFPVIYTAPSGVEKRFDVTVTVEKANPPISKLEGITAQIGQTLGDINLPTGFTWEDPTIVLDDYTEYHVLVDFIPEDTDNYNTLYGIDVVVTVTENIPTEFDDEYLELMWNDVIVVNVIAMKEELGRDEVASFQWYKDGEAIPNATKQFYCELGGLDGEYKAVVTTKYGREITVGPKRIELQADETFKVAANPSEVSVGQEFKVEVGGLTPEEMKKAQLYIYDVKGSMVYESLKISESNSVILPARTERGICIVIVIVNNNKMQNCKLLVK